MTKEEEQKMNDFKQELDALLVKFGVRMMPSINLSFVKLEKDLSTAEEEKE